MTSADSRKTAIRITEKVNEACGQTVPGQLERKQRFYKHHEQAEEHLPLWLPADVKKWCAFIKATKKGKTLYPLSQYLQGNVGVF